MHKHKGSKKCQQWPPNLRQSELPKRAMEKLETDHLHLGDEAELVFDLHEDGVEGQLVGLLVQPG